MAQELVLQTSHTLTHKGFLVGVGGNVSVRVEGQKAMAITPSGRDYLTLEAENICVRGLDQERLSGELAPSVEMGMHAAVYLKRPDVNAVVHTHQPFASIFSLIGEPIPPITDEQVYQLGDRIALVPYAISGSVELASHVASAAGNQCNAFILQNHGVLSTGLSAQQAVNNAQILEKVAQIYYYALTSGRTITTLPAESIETLFATLKSKQQAEIERKQALDARRLKQRQENTVV